MVKWIPASLLLLLWLGGLLRVRPWRQAATWSQKLAQFALWSYLLLLIPLCFTPFATHHGAWSGMQPIMVGTAPTNPIPFRGAFTPDFWLNILMTVPFGWLLRQLYHWRWSQIFLAGLALTVLIEGGQFLAGLTVQLNRWADANDIITNITGTLLGSLLRGLWERFRVQ